MEVSQQIIEVLDYLCKKLGIAIDWSSDNVLPYLQELCNKYIQWEISTSVVWIIVGALFVVAGMILLKIRKNAIKRKEHEKYVWSIDCWYPYAAICAWIVIMIGAIIVLCQIFDIIKCINFPELQIYEYLEYKISNIGRE